MGKSWHDKANRIQNRQIWERLKREESTERSTWSIQDTIPKSGDPDQPPLWSASNIFTQWISTVLLYAETNSSYFLHITAVSGIAICYSSSYSRRAACEPTASSSAKSSRWLNGNGKQSFSARPSTTMSTRRTNEPPFTDQPVPFLLLCCATNIISNYLKTELRNWLRKGPKKGFEGVWVSCKTVNWMSSSAEFPDQIKYLCQQHTEQYEGETEWPGKLSTLFFLCQNCWSKLTPKCSLNVYTPF